MVFRSDIRVDWTQSPRLIFIDAPSTEVTIQDLYDTLRRLEERPWEGVPYPTIIEIAGKEELGGGVLVGLTAKLLNAKLAFQARKTTASSGTVTTSDNTGRTLTDSAATFIADGVVPGAWISNLTDGSIATVLRVVSETQLITDVLGDGTDNRFEIGDVYKVKNVTQCFITGGNLVAADANNVAVSPTLPTAGTQINLTAASSATISDVALQTSTKYLIESLRPDHMGFGNIFYWDPANGNDANDGLLPETAKATFAAAQSLCMHGNGDTVFIVHPGAGSLLITETINISVDSLCLRGPGNAVFAPTSDAADTITISASNVSVSGFTVNTAAGPTPRNCITTNGVDAFRIENVGILFSSGRGFSINGGQQHQINRFSISNTTSAGLWIKDTKIFTITNGLISNSSTWGVDLSATNANDTELVNFDFVVISSNATGGMRIGTGCDLTTITERCHIGQSATQPIRLQDNGTTTYDLLTIRQNQIVDLALDEPLAGHTASGSVGEALASAGLTPEQAKQLLLIFVNSL